MFRIFLAALIALTAVGCRRERLHDTKNPAVTGASEDILRVHWLGKKGLVGNTNTAYLLSIWNLPEAAVLENQILDKLALAPWRVLARETNATLTNTPAALLLRPLLEDSLQHETFVNVRRLRDSEIDGTVAVRLAPERATLWRSNIAGLLQALPPRCGIRAVPAGDAWRLQSAHSTNYLSLVASQGWTVARIGPKPVTSTQVANQLPKQPWIHSTGTNDWLQLHANLHRLGATTSSPSNSAPFSLSGVDLAWYCEGDYVRTRGRFAVAQPLQAKLEPWTIPTNVIHNPMLNFTAIRGFQAYLEANPLLKLLNVSAAPNQLFLWSLQGGPFFSYAAFPMPNAGVTIDATAPALKTLLTPWLSTKARGALSYNPTNHSISWMAVPVLTPTFLSVTSNVGELLLGQAALMKPPPTGKPFPNELVGILERGTNLVFYDWEITQHRLADLFPTLQAARVACRFPQLPAQAVGIPFFKAVAPKLGNAVTTLKLRSPTELTFERKSHSGLTALEWHLVADWMESPTFPCGLHSFTAPAPLAARRSPINRPNPVSPNNAAGPK